MTSACYFKEPLRNEIKSFFISKFCFPWHVYTLTPSSFTQDYSPSSKSQFSTETKQKFPAESKTTEDLRLYSVTRQSTFGEFISPHQRAQIFLYDSDYYWRLVILWTHWLLEIPNIPIMRLQEGTIGHIVKFFFDVKLQKNQPVKANGTSDDEELENGNGENDITSSAALEFDALNELLSFTTDGKKKSTVFHNIVELLEILLDRACSSSGASTMRGFQSLTRCLTDVDHAALTSNSFEFHKVLIEEEINLDTVSSIFQMLIRMNKNFENFIPLRFCELILAAGSLEIVKPYFRVFWLSLKPNCSLWVWLNI